MQTIINAVLSSIRTNARTIEQLTPVTSLNNDDSFEINGGKRVTYAVLKGMLDKILNVVHDLGNMASVEAAMNAAKAYAVVSKQNTRIIVWTHGNDAGIIFQTHIDMENARQFALLDGSPAKCKVRHLTINITDHTVADGGWQELITPVSFSYDSVRRAITANGPKNPGKEPTASWPVVTLPLGDSSHAGLMDPADKRKLGCIVDLGVVSNQAAAENAAAERTVTENSNVRIIMWRTGDNGRGDGGQIIQSRWGNYYVIQVMMFVGQEHSCRYRLITTGGNYSVGEWNDLILPSEITYDTANHQVRYRGIRPNSEKTLFTIPVADDEELGIIRIGGPFYLGENDELNIHVGNGITFDGFRLALNLAEDGWFVLDDDGKLKIEEGWRPVPQWKRSATPADNCFVYATEDPESKTSVLNAPDTLLKQKDGHLMFQKGMWNPNNEAVYYTRNQVPVATAGADGAMAKEVFSRLGTGATIYEGTATGSVVPIVYPDWAEGGARTFNINAATSARAGVMSAADKATLSSLSQHQTFIIKHALFDSGQETFGITSIGKSSTSEEISMIFGNSSNMFPEIYYKVIDGVQLLFLWRTYGGEVATLIPVQVWAKVYSDERAYTLRLVLPQLGADGSGSLYTLSLEYDRAADRYSYIENL